MVKKSRRQLELVTSTKTDVDNPNDGRIPEHVWALMQQAGEHAVNRMNELLSTSKFHKLRGSDKIALIRLAMDRAHGKPDAPLRKIVQINANLSDFSFESLADKASLPEYRGLKDITPLLKTAVRGGETPIDSPHDLDLPNEDSGAVRADYEVIEPQGNDSNTVVQTTKKRPANKLTPFI